MTAIVGGSPGEAERAPTSRSRRWWVLVILCCSLLLVSVDATVLHLVLPALSADLGASGAEQIWIVAIYSLLAAPLLLACGSLGDRHGRRRLLTIGYAVFTVGSLGAALSPGVAALVASRAVLGVGAALIMPATLSILRHTFPEREQRRIAIGIWSGVAAFGAGLGPLVGGVLLEHFSWHAAFLINVPILVVVAIATRLVVAESANPTSGSWDWPSAVLATLGVLGVAIAIVEVRTPPGIATGVVTGIAGIALLAQFVRRQRRRPHPLLDLRLFADRRFAVGVGSALLVMAALTGVALLFGQYLQLVLNLRPGDAAQRLAAVIGAAGVGAIAAAPLITLWGSRAVSVLGFGLCAAALAAAGVGIGLQENLALLLPCLAVIGFSVSLSLTAASDAVLAAAPAEHAGAAAAVEETAYELGTGLGVTTLGSVAALGYAANLSLDALPIAALPAPTVDLVSGGLGDALAIARALPEPAASLLAAAARSAFLDGLRLALLCSCVAVAAAAVAAARLLPRRRDT